MTGAQTRTKSGLSECDCNEVGQDRAYWGSTFPFGSLSDFTRSTVVLSGLLTVTVCTLLRDQIIHISLALIVPKHTKLSPEPISKFRISPAAKDGVEQVG